MTENLEYFLLTRNIFVLFPDMTRSVECLSCLARDWLRSEKSNNSSPSGFRQGGTPGADGQPAQIITRGFCSRRVREVFHRNEGHASKWIPRCMLTQDREIQGSTLKLMIPLNIEATLWSKDKFGLCKVDAGCTDASEGPL